MAAGPSAVSAGGCFGAGGADHVDVEVCNRPNQVCVEMCVGMTLWREGAAELPLKRLLFTMANFNVSDADIEHYGMTSDEIEAFFEGDWLKLDVQHALPTVTVSSKWCRECN